MPSAEETALQQTQQTVDKPSSSTAKEEPTTQQIPAIKKGFLRDTFESILVTVIMALFGMTFIVQAVKVPTGSMLNTILIGDHLLVNKFIFGQDGLMLDKFTPHRPIRRGDVIVFKYPNEPTTNYVKRVIGLPGETIEVKGNHVFIDGKELPEQYVQANRSLHDENAPLEIVSTKPAPQGAKYKVYYSNEVDEPEPDTEKTMLGQKFAVGAPFKIPENSYFAMGDNRDNSQDSRYWGIVPRDHIVGRAWVVYYSMDLAKDKNGKDAPDNLLSAFFSRSRWGRIGTLIK
jgi:signal peptidase I